MLIGVLFFCFLDKASRKPIRIGFSGELTGSQAELGIQERNGVQLAVEKINASGGIAGRKIELIIRDDFGVPEKAKLADEELIKDGVIAIIGHTASAQTLAGLEVTNPAHIVMLSPTVSTPELSGLDDYFFRVYPCFKESSETFAKYIIQSIGIKRIAIIYDLDNLAYSKTYSKTFIDKFEAIGGCLTEEVAFSSKSQPDFSTILSRLHESNAEGMLIIASDIDTALISQRSRIMGWNIPLFATAWAQTETLINSGGEAVEGLRLEQSYGLSSQSSAFIDFKANYQARFGKDPSFGAAFSYEAALVLSEALKRINGKPQELKNALLNIHGYKGLTDIFSIDEFGDVNRSFYLSTIQNGQFIIINKLTSNNYGGE